MIFFTVPSDRKRENTGGVGRSVILIPRFPEDQ
jgi:hypothetical protein